MTVNDIAVQLFGHFSPEERSIPDSVTYPGRNAAVKNAINGALQEVFSSGSPWVRFRERGVLLYAPATVSIRVTKGSTAATIAAADWENWMSGCAIQIDGGGIQNRIENDSRDVELKFPWDGESSITGDVVVTGDLQTSLGADVTFPRLIACGWIEYLGSTVLQWSSDGNKSLVIPTSGAYYALRIYGDVTRIATLAKYIDGVPVAQWGVVGIPVETEDPTTVDWEGSAQDDAAGDPAVAFFDDLRSATVYHTSIDLPADVLQVHGPVKLDGVGIDPAPDHRIGPTLADGDFGFWRIAENNSAKPVTYQVEAWDSGSNDSPAFRLALSHYPTKTTFLEYRAMVCPLVVSDLTSTATLPVPFQFIESVFYPIARKRLAGCPFFRAGDSAPEIADSYKEARAALAGLNARRNSGCVMRPIY